MSVFNLILIACSCILVFLGSYFWINGALARKGPSAPDPGIEPSRATGATQDRGDALLLFDAETLVDANDKARDTLVADPHKSDWHHIAGQLQDVFSNLPTSLDAVQEHVILTNPQHGRSLEIQKDGNLCRVRIGLGAQAMTREPVQPPFLLSRSVVDLAPFPIWHSAPDGSVIWHNRAFEILADRIGLEDYTREPSFVDLHGVPFQGYGQRRLSVRSIDGQTQLWFDVMIEQLNGGRVCYATDVNAVVDAEIAQRNFVQTLAKTFAQLPIGLAIFDRNRRLALFNPALIDLMSLQAEFLSSRPDLTLFFDRLRDSKMMPEPKNYADWREQIADLAEAAADGRYSETWTLPSGSVYSVSGRPHPDGAVAFLFEDITAEIALTRGFRAELELGQAVLDHVEEAITIFATDGRLVLTNAAFEDLWGKHQLDADQQATVIEATRFWQERSRPSPVWGDIRDFVRSRDGRSDWNATITLTSGRHVICHVQPVVNGATLVRFCPVSVAIDLPDKVTRLSG